MREHGLSPNQLRLYVATTDSDHDEPIFPNLAADMAPDGPNQLWVADITYVAIAIGFVYLAAMLRLPRRDPGCLVTPGCRLNAVVDLLEERFLLLDLAFSREAQFEFVHDHRSQIGKLLNVGRGDRAWGSVDDAQCSEVMSIMGLKRNSGVETQSELARH